ncbi:MAG: aspartate--tRNA ligase [Acidimicrobiales bacterium]|nr:aspartate--tRNA ligase [Acidimicrobiaceae bacterium]MXZ15833.1 aspartate--tRNA ligase [Acidimicrobiales bacterium]MDE0677391.1 aspartate--tRNA ligase [Acidimicrobiaceae bacterium]MYA81291.1 aspartate--tRNA ligase [Acidimicrobiales bacterium]MYG60388.1 aspartate--tRNA ligase [Acidimicrobiales bacterium]
MGDPMRTDYCGRLSRADIGRDVTVCGWVSRRREHGEHLAFVDLRDRTGIVQCVVDHAHDLRSEYVLAVTGTVRERPLDTANPDLATGEIEIGDATVEVLSRSEPPPFQIDGRTEVDEMLRIRHRYLDLRNPRMHSNLVNRARVNAAIRRSMEAAEFIEVETPTLVASTPEGARDFVVPSRLHQGRFYALPQSPQLFKQLCMVGGIDRYYQIARCLRDEDLRADRQFEFSQLDLEMSFASGAEVRAVISEAVAEAAEEITGVRPAAMPEITWHEAIDRYGSDKPDLRFGLELTELTDLFAETGFNAFKAPAVRGIRVPGGGDISRNAVDDLTKQCQRWGAKGLVWMRVSAGEPLAEGARSAAGGRLAVTSPVAKFMSDAEIDGVLGRLGAEPGDMCYLVADTWRRASGVLGLLRLELGRPPVNEGGLHFLWVVDFPLFEDVSADGLPIPAHHPFTMPHADDLDVVAAASARMASGGGFDADTLLDVRSQAYDLVLNGWELGSGSVRIHRGDIQQQVFDLLGIDPAAAQERFGFLLDAFRYGAPPHAGFAFGIDRLAALLCGEENIREVIAFPKSQSGADPLTNAPSHISADQLEELGLAVVAGDGEQGAVAREGEQGGSADEDES